jgi:hypothetical protein
VNNLRQEGMEHENSDEGLATLPLFHQDQKTGIFYEV